MTNIVFFGTSEFGAIILEKLIQADTTKPVLVVTMPDKPSGRKGELIPPPVKEVAVKYNIPVSQEEEIESQRAKIEELHPDFLVLAAYGAIVPKEILDIPRYGALNVHPSLLPKYRGPSPVQSAILDGEEKTGVTIIRMDEEIDHGPIVVQKELTEFIGNFTSLELKEKLASLGAQLLVDAIPSLVEGNILPKEQEHAKATYTEKIQREDGEIDWSKPAVYIERQVRAFYPWPGAFTFWKDKRVKILKAHVADDKLVVDELQLEGKKPTTMREFLLGNKDFHVGP